MAAIVATAFGVAVNDSQQLADEAYINYKNVANLDEAAKFQADIETTMRKRRIRRA